jgi:hypothetical protein
MVHGVTTRLHQSFSTVEVGADNGGEVRFKNQYLHISLLSYIVGTLLCYIPEVEGMRFNRNVTKYLVNLHGL